MFARLCAGRDQAYHLARRTQDGCPGRGQHSHRVERRARGPGVPAQEWTDPQVTRLVALHSTAVIKLTQDFSSLLSSEALSGFTLKVYEAEMRNSAPDFLLSRNRGCTNILSYHVHYMGHYVFVVESVSIFGYILSICAEVPTVEQLGVHYMKSWIKLAF